MHIKTLVPAAKLAEPPEESVCCVNGEDTNRPPPAPAAVDVLYSIYPCVCAKLAPTVAVATLALACIIA